ncbi:DUF397 domain-containing protein [Streptomyces sp. NPDC094038]|uniref:DUF397 domain-containing protein n=1 Tax=Streptomyces sp. NPDC094038 TaxID=3366055 RepID=UPI003803D7D4
MGRDSKVPHGPALCFEAASWTAFIGELKAGDHRHRVRRAPVVVHAPGSPDPCPRGPGRPLNSPKEPEERTTRPPALPGRTARVTRPSDQLAGAGYGRLRSPQQPHTDIGPRPGLASRSRA